MLKTAAIIFSLIGMILTAYFELKPDAIEYDEHTAGYQVRILRDIWGVPHIFGVTDADVAYGLGYAHGEDDFKTIQQSMLAARGISASVYGRKAVPGDYFVPLLKIWDIVNSKYESDLSADTRAVCESYASGLNYYASLHPDEVAPGLFPLTGKDVVAGFVLKTPLFFGLHKRIKELFEPERKHEITRQPLAQNPNSLLDWSGEYGSNTFSVAPSRSADNKTRLAINSHQPWDGPFAWYEAHLHSQEGWDMVGGLFPGSPVALVGHNRHLGWGHTVNKPDLVDTYILDINPENPNQYYFDGKWLDLKVSKAKIKVKILGPIHWTVEQEVLSSVHGPVIRRPHGTYAIRYAGYGDIRQVEQWYRMNKARNFEEWQEAMRIQAIPKFNCGYADAEGNIYYLYNALLPKRVAGYDWSKYLPGNTSETLWTEYVPFDRLPQVKNPSSGFIQNCNSSPFQTTTGADNLDPLDYQDIIGIETRMTNRALRALELLGNDEAITEQEFIDYKFDMAYSSKSDMAKYVQEILSTPAPDDSVVQEALAVLRSWNLTASPENRGAAVAVISIKSFVQQSKQNKKVNLFDIFTETARELKERYGRIDVAWKQVNRLIRGKLDLGLGGAPDVLHAVYGEKIAKGKLKGRIGDSYILLVTWDENGQVSSRSVHQYGSATIRERSEHYADQAYLFAKRKLKPVWLDESEILANIEREYRPGEELQR
ncbi:MAG: acylase [bacterium]